MEIEDSFHALFNDWDFENSDGILPLVRKCISLSPGEKEVVRALEISLCFYLKKFPVDELEEEVFQIACPAAEKLFVEKLKYLEKNPTGCVESLSVFTKILSYFERVFDYLNEIPKIAIIEVRSLLVATSEILLSCFSHCKMSEEVYGSLLSSLTECLSNFFKKCCSLQDQLLQFLTEKAECDPEDDREVLLLDELMTFLSRVGIAFINLEVKTLAKVWKAFVFLTEKHACCLKNNHDIGETIRNLSNSIISNMEAAIYKKSQDFSKSVKLSCFLLKLVIKFSEVFIKCLQHCQNSLLNLLLMLCKFDAGIVTETKCKANINQDLMNQLTIGTDPLLSQIIADVEFVKECCAASEEMKKTVEFSILCCLVVKKLMNSAIAVRSLWLNENENILEWILLSSSSYQFISCSSVRLPNILINGKQTRFTDLYEYALVTTSTFLMTVTSEEYCLVEGTLIRNILQTNPMKALFATDIWCLLARFADSELCFSQIVALSKMLQLFHPRPERVEKCYLASLIRRLFPLLAGSHRGLFLKSFPRSFYSLVWDGLAVGGLTPTEITDIKQALLSDVESLLDEDGSNCFEMGIPTTHQSKTSEKFGSKVLKLWKFNCDILSSTSESVDFLKIICALTASLMADIPSEDLFMVLGQMKKLLTMGQPTCVKLFFIWMLNSLSTVRIPPGNSQKKIIITIAETFRDLLLSKEPLAKEKALETFYTFSHMTSHGEVISMSVQNAPQLKVEVTNYFKRTSPDRTDFDLNEYLCQLSRLKYQHVCPKVADPEAAVIPKKMKLNLREVVMRWKEDGKVISEHFHSLTETEKRELRNVCNSVLSFT